MNVYKSILHSQFNAVFYLGLFHVNKLKIANVSEVTEFLPGCVIAVESKIFVTFNSSTCTNKINNYVVKIH
jgi:hypothetical protein